VIVLFEQAVLEGEVDDDLLQGLRLATKILHLVGGRGARSVAGEPLFAGLKELLGVQGRLAPAVWNAVLQA
jgi:hypothetical protein